MNYSFHETKPIDKVYYEKIAEMIKNNTNRYAYLLDENTIKDGSIVRNANVIYANCNIVRFTNDYYPAFLNSFELLNYANKERDPSYVIYSVIQTPFYQYVVKKKNNNIHKTVSEYQVDFITENKVQFLITDKNSESLKRLPLKIKRIVESEKERFWFVELQ